MFSFRDHFLLHKTIKATLDLKVVKQQTMTEVNRCPEILSTKKEACLKILQTEKQHEFWMLTHNVIKLMITPSSRNRNKEKGPHQRNTYWHQHSFTVLQTSTFNNNQLKRLIVHIKHNHFPHLRLLNFHKIPIFSNIRDTQ